MTISHRVVLMPSLLSVESDATLLCIPFAQDAGTAENQCRIVRGYVSPAEISCVRCYSRSRLAPYSHKGVIVECGDHTLLCNGNAHV